jgi:TRAP-type C4-dicarboxylate transport system substrate-binding protein
MRRISWFAVVVLAIVALVAACAPAQQAPAKPAEPAKPAAQPAKPAAEPAKPAAEPAKPAAAPEAAKPTAAGAKRIRIGTCAPNKPDDLSLAWLLTEFKNRVEKGSNGQLEVQVHWAGSLYCEVSAIKAMLDGAIEMSTSSVQNAGTFTKGFFVLDMPFLFNSFDEVKKTIVLGPFNQQIKDLVNKDQPNMLTIAYINTDGLRDLECSKRVVTPSDMRGLKIRTTETPTDVATWKALGAIATPIAWAETYTAGTQNLIQCIGVGAGFWPITAKMYEWHKYITLIDYQTQLNVVHINKKFLESLPQDQQKLILDTAAALEKEGADIDIKYTEKALEWLKTQGKQEIITLTPEQKQQWVERAKPVYDEFKDRIPAGLLEGIQNHIKTLR